MTRGQRRAHLAIWLLLAPAVLAIIATAMLTRPKNPPPPSQIFLGDSP